MHSGRTSPLRSRAALGLTSLLAWPSQSWAEEVGGSTVQAAPAEQRALTARVVGPPGCDDFRPIERSFSRRLTTVQLQDAGTEPAPIRFSFQQEAAAMLARLSIELETHEQLTREIEAADCASAMEAIAFVAAVALDPGVRNPLVVADVAPEPPPPQAPQPKEEEAPPEVALPPARAVSPARRWVLSASGVGATIMAPEMLWGGALFVENAAEAGGAWAPGVRLGGSVTVPSTFESDIGNAEFFTARGHLDLCPSQLQVGVWRLQPCATMTAGAVWASGEAPAEASNSVRPWVSPGLSLLSEWRLGRVFGVHVRGSGLVPVVQDRYLFDETVISETPVVTVDLNVGVSLSFQ